VIILLEPLLATRSVRIDTTVLALNCRLYASCSLAKKAFISEEAAGNSDIDPMIEEEKPNFSDPEHREPMTDEGNLSH